MKRATLAGFAMLALTVPLMIGGLEIGSCGLYQEDFELAVGGGVDDWKNSYPWGMEQADLDGDGNPEIYIGTASHALCVQVPRMDFLLALDPNFVPPARWKCPNELWDPNDQSAFISALAQSPGVFRGVYDEGTGTWDWQRVWTPDPNNGEPYAFRGARVFNGALYMMGNNSTVGGSVWKTTDGVNFEKASPTGMGLGLLVRGLRASAVFKDKLYVGADSLGLVWCSSDPSEDPNSWELACDTGWKASGGGTHEQTYYTGTLDAATATTLSDDVLAPLPNGLIAGWAYVRVTSAADPNIVQTRQVIYNTTNGTLGTIYVQWGAAGQAFDPVPDPGDAYEVFNPVAANNTATWQMDVFDGHLWVAPYNYWDGAEVWKSADPAPGNWTRVVSGAYGNPITQGFMTVRNFNDEYLMLGTVVYPPNVDGFEDFQGCEILRIDKNDNVEVLVGMDRDPSWPGTNNGAPLSGLGEGFDYQPNVYSWYTAEHDGWFYVGTYDMGGMVMDIVDEIYGGVIPPEFDLVYELLFGTDELRRGGFDLWRTKDGINWVPVVLDGFGDPDNYGIRNMQSTPYGLVVGVANAVDGFEVYLGKK